MYINSKQGSGQSQKVNFKAFPCLGNPDLWKVRVYSHALHANLSIGASLGGFMVFIKGNGGVSYILWWSKKLERVSKTQLASEAIALSEAADAEYLVTAMIQETFERTIMVEVNCYSNSKSLKDHLQSSNIISVLRLRVDMTRKWLNWRRSMLCWWKENNSLLILWQNMVRQLLCWWKSLDLGLVSKSSKPAKCKYCKYCFLFQEVRWWPCSNRDSHESSNLTISYIVKAIGHAFCVIKQYPWLHQNIWVLHPFRKDEHSCSEQEKAN